MRRVVIAIVLAGIAIAPAPLGAEETGLVVHAKLVNQNACISRTETPDGNLFLEPSESSMSVTIATDVSAPPHGGQEIAMTNTTVAVSFGSEVLQAGVDSGILSDGMLLPAVLDISLDGINTTETTQSTTAAQTPKLKVLQGVAQPLAITFELPDGAWTPVDAEQTVTLRENSLTLAVLLPVLVDPGLTMIAECEPTGTATLYMAPGSGKPSAPTGLQVEPGDGQVSMVWTPPAESSAITKYHVSVVDSTGNPPTGIGSTTRTVPGTETGMTFSGLKIGVGYRFRVTAENAIGIGASSAASALATPMPFVSIGDASTFEGNAGNRSLRFTISLSAVSPIPVWVSYGTTNGSAKAGSDYTAKTGTVLISPGKASVEVTVSVRGDVASEATEAFGVGIGLPSNARLGSSIGIGKIVNDDPGPQARRVHIGDASIIEGRTGTRSIRFTVSLSAASSKATSVKFTTTNGTAAVSASDYTKTSGVVTIPAGHGSAIIAVPVRGDTAKENNETFKVTLSQPSGASLGRSGATGTIHNDDF